MNKTITRSVLAALLSLAMILSLAGCGTSSSYSEAETKAAATESEFGAEPSTEKNVYTAQILDEKNLLSNDEKTKLLADLKPFEEYCDVFFWTTEDDADDAIDQAKEKLGELYGDEKAVCLVLNMKLRQITIVSSEDMSEYIGNAEAEEITADVCTLAGNKRYYESANRAYSLMLKKIKG